MVLYSDINIFYFTLLEREVPIRQRQVERRYSKNLMPDRLFFQTTPAFPPSLLALMSKYRAWVTSKQENENFQLAKLKSVGSCEGIDVTHCGRHLHLSTISSRSSGRRGRPVSLYQHSWRPDKLEALVFGFPHFFSVKPSFWVAGWLQYEGTASVSGQSGRSDVLPRLWRAQKKNIRSQLKALILFYNSNFNGSYIIKVQRITTFRNVIQNMNTIWFYWSSIRSEMQINC